jgi:hypothetical protein
MNAAMKYVTVVLLSSLLCITAGCNRRNLSPMPTISDEAKAELAAPIDCSRARQDVAILEEEKASVAKEIAAGARSIIPFSAAAGILLGDYRDRIQVATGQYNSDIEAKISLIRAQCGLPNGTDF